MANDKDWRAEKRFNIAQHALGAKRIDATTHISPSGRYSLEVSTVDTPTGWKYSEGVVEKIGDPLTIATVLQNYGAFPFAWAEGHANGHDYLICGEDYQGQTIIELDTQKRRDYLAETAQPGHGFCWANYKVLGELAVVEGCYWACPHELVVFDFSDPMEGALPELHRWAGELGKVAWPAGGDILRWTFYRELWEQDGRGYEDTTLDEDVELVAAGDKQVAITFSAAWEVGTAFESAEITIAADSEHRNL